MKKYTSSNIQESKEVKLNPSLHLRTSPMVQQWRTPPANAGDIRNTESISGLGRYPAEGNGNLLQYFCLENHMDRGAWQAIVHRVAKSQTWLKWLNMHTCTTLKLLENCERIQIHNVLQYLLNSLISSFLRDSSSTSWLSLLSPLPTCSSLSGQPHSSNRDPLLFRGNYGLTWQLKILFDGEIVNTPMFVIVTSGSVL